MKALLNQNGQALSSGGQALVSGLFYDSAAAAYIHDVDYSDDQEYTYSDIDTYKDTPAALSIRPSLDIHMLNIGNVKNVRDLGGWQCDGGTVKYGKIFRGGKLDTWNVDRTTTPYELSSATDFLTESDKAILRDKLGISVDIDLRVSDLLDQAYSATPEQLTSQALTVRSFSPIGADVSYKPFCVVMYQNGVRLTNEHHFYIYTAKAIQEVFKSVNDNKPVYIHCTQGADRTGTICFILKALLGVSLSDNDKDYELSSFALDNNSYRPRTMTTSGSGSYKAMVSYLSGLDGDSLRDKVANWLVQASEGLEEPITYADINQFRADMIQGGDPNELV